MKLTHWLCCFAVCARCAAEPGYRLIAHRGGVVEDQYPDNTAAALQAAHARGYWMVEVDLRESRDGIIVMHHDLDFKEYFHDPRQLKDSTWDQIHALTSDLAGQHPWRFEDLVQACAAAHMRLMLDTKIPHTPGFPVRTEAILRRYRMLENCYIIGTQDALDHFVGLAPVGVNFRKVKAALAADPSAASKYFLFEHGDMTPEMVRWCQAHGVKVVPTINLYHYYDAKTMAGKSRSELAPVILAAAHRDIVKLQGLGVKEFQIDSEFDRWFKTAATTAP